MLLLQQVISHGAFGNTQLDAFKNKSFLQHVFCPRTSVPTYWILTCLVNFLETRVISVYLLELLKSQHNHLTFLQDQTPFAQRIYNFFSLPTNMLKNNGKVLHVIYPFNMPLVQCFFPSNELQSMIISV